VRSAICTGNLHRNLLSKFHHSTETSTNTGISALARFQLKVKPEGANGDMKSLWETKEKSGNETGQTINRMRLPFLISHY